MSQPREGHVHSDQVLYVSELLESILLRLEHKDIVVASGVCTFWKDCIAGSHRLKKKIHKLSVFIGDHENPHFDDLTEDSSNAIIPRHELQGQNLWDLVRECEDKYTKTIHESTNLEQFKILMKSETQDYWSNMLEIRQDFQGVRWRGNGWPRELQALHCDLCNGWHTDFRFDHLHPLLQFLEDVDICFRGHGDKFLVDFHIVSSSMAALTCWDDSCRCALHTARSLAKAHRAVEAGGVSNDLFVSPPVTKLIEANVSCLENPDGLTLGTVVPYMIRAFRRHLHYWRIHCHEFEISRVRRGEVAQMESAPTYPTDEDWERHIAGFPKITSMWEKTLDEVDAMMSRVSFWEPVLAEAIEIHDNIEIIS